MHQQRKIRLHRKRPCVGAVIVWFLLAFIFAFRHECNCKIIARCPHHECITYSDGDCSACVYIGQTKDVSALLVAGLQFCSWTRRHYYIKFLKRCRSTQIVEFRQWTWCCFSRVRPWFFLCTRMVCACIDAACIHPCSWLLRSDL